MSWWVESGVMDEGETENKQCWGCLQDWFENHWSIVPTTHLKFLGLLSAQRLKGKAEVVRLWKRTQVKIVLGIDAWWNVNIELQQLQKLSLQLIPGGREKAKIISLANVPFDICQWVEISKNKILTVSYSRKFWFSMFQWKSLHFKTTILTRTPNDKPWSSVPIKKCNFIPYKISNDRWNSSKFKINNLLSPLPTNRIIIPTQAETNQLNITNSEASDNKHP